MGVYDGLLTGDNLREIMSGDLPLALFRIDEKIREKIREFGFTSSVDVQVEVGLNTADELKNALKKRGFHVTIQKSVFREGRFNVDVRWLGAGCPSTVPYSGGF